MDEESDEVVLAQMGLRLRKERINQSLTQATVAERAGIRQATLSRIENGEDFTVSTLIAVLRSLGRLDNLDSFLPDSQLSPIALAKRQGAERKRVRPRTSTDAAWTWGDDD